MTNKIQKIKNSKKVNELISIVSDGYLNADDEESKIVVAFINKYNPNIDIMINNHDSEKCGDCQDNESFWNYLKQIANK